MITIEHLEVLFEAEREQDELRFQELFAAHMARHELERGERKSAAAQAEADRSLDGGGVA